MKLLNLQLVRFGRFTDTRLDFTERGPSFHVIYGPNEAGKSTALRALTGLLYGIAHNTTDAFLHDMKDLRVAGELESGGGQRMTFIRRKGNRDTLLDTDGKPLPDGVLMRLLGGAGEEVFTTIFRLDHASLVRGGEDLLAGKGDLAESLFQAGTGITGLRQALAALEAEAEQLFKPRSTTALVNRALNAYEDARKRSRDLAAPPKQWVEKSDALKTMEQKLQELKDRISALRGSKERLDRFRLALPHLTVRKNLLSELETIGTIFELSESAPREREDAERRQREATLRKKQSESTLGDLRRDFDQLQLPGELLAQAEAIASVYQRLASYRLALRDLPEVRAEESQFDADALALLREVRPELPLTEAQTLRLTAVQRTRIRALADRHPALQERLRTASDRAESTSHELEAKKHSLDQAAIARDAAELEGALERVRKQGDLDTSLRDETMALRTADEQGVTDLKRLTPWSGTLEKLESLAVPSLETVEQFDSELNGLSNEQTLLMTRRDENQQGTTRLESEIRALRLGGDVPTEPELQEARERREQGWQLVRRAWLQRAADAAQETAFDPERPLPEAYENSVAHADAIADRLRREANRVTKLAGLLADKESCDQRQKELQSQQTNVTTRLQSCQERWREAWQPTGITPLSPKEMRSWLTRQTALVAQARGVRERRHMVEQLQRRITEHAHDLSQALLTLGEPPRAESETLAALLYRSQAGLQRLKETANQRVSLENEVKRLAAERDKATRERDKARSDLETWQADWQKAVGSLGLSADTRPEEASAALEKLDALFKKLDDSVNRRTRADEMQRHIGQFNADVATLVQSLVPELRDLPPDQAASRLQALFNKAQQDAVRHQTLGRQVEQAQEAMDTADREVGRATADLKCLMERARCTDLATLHEVERKSARAHELMRLLANADSTMAEFTAGAALEEFLVEVATIDTDQLPFQIDELEQDIRSLDEQRSQLEQQIGQERAVLQAMDGSEHAALAAEEAQCALASVRTYSERYLRLRFASEVVRRHIEYYREQNQDPMIKRAGEIFPRLTRGSFAGLKTGFDDKDRPVLLGVRPSGDEVEISGMSRGTRDQLFLALRLASLERQLSSGEPLPLVVDDVLINFDDARAQATLELLADMARQTQILFFTHHTRLVELARRTVPPTLLKVHDLDQRSL